MFDLLLCALAGILLGVFRGQRVKLTILLSFLTAFVFALFSFATTMFFISSIFLIGGILAALLGPFLVIILIFQTLVSGVVGGIIGGILNYIVSRVRR
jgi:hypothetical protein